MLEKIINKTINGDSDSEQLIAAIFGIALTTKGKNFLELGVRSGDTTLPLLTVCSLLGGSLTSVDIIEHSFDCPNEIEKYWNFVKSDAISFLENNNKYYDLVFIDDWHDGLHVAREIELISKFATPSTVILLHDLMYSGSQPNYNESIGIGEFGNGGPYNAVSRLNKDDWEFATLPFSHGLTILRKK